MPKTQYTRTKSREWLLDVCMKCPRYVLEKHEDWPMKVFRCHSFTPPRMLDESFNWHECPLRDKLPKPWRRYPEGTAMHAVQHRLLKMEVLLK